MASRSERTITPLLVLAILTFLGGAALWLFLGESWLDEGKYLIKGYWHVTGRLRLYGPNDSSDYMPLAFTVPGYWEKLFGPGPISGRILGTLLGLGTLIGLVPVARRLAPPRFADASLLLLALTPMVYPFFGSVSAYPVVSAASVLAIWMILSDTEEHRAWKCVAIGFAYYVLYFTRVNMIFGIALFFVYHGVRAESARLSRLGVALATTLALSLATLLSYPKQIWYVAVEFPGLSSVLRRVGLLPDRYPLIERYTASHFGWTWTTAQVQGAARAFVDGLLVQYPITLALCVTAIVLGVRRRGWKDAGAFCGFYFLVMALIHYAGSQSYCPTCVMCYAHYFYVIGALGCASALADLAELLAPLWQRNKVLFAGGLVALVLAAQAIMLRAFMKEGDVRLRGHFSLLLPDAARWVGAHVPAGAPVLLMSPTPLLVEAAFLSGHPFEPTCINQWHSWLDITKPVPSEIRPELLRQISAQSEWTNEIMEDWLRTKYDWVIWQNEPSPGPWREILQRDFVKEAEYVVPERGDRIELWHRASRPSP
jgi:hypothetical protein